MMKAILFSLSITIIFFLPLAAEAKKIKNSFTIDKNSSEISINSEKNLAGRKILLSDSMEGNNHPEILDDLKNVSFNGYEKEAGSNLESFILVNKSGWSILGFEIRIDYLDMKDRMLHSRIVKEQCDVPSSEARKIDLKSWDKQHSFYYHLGNEPRRVSTPYKVRFSPVAFWIGE